MLSDQVDYLRTELSRSHSAAARPQEAPLALDPTGLAIPVGDNPFNDSDEPEDELRALARDGLLTPEELEANLQRLVPH